MSFLKSDLILRELLQDQKTVTTFLDAVFGFLKRNTDFYYIQKDAGDRIGFPRGMKEQIVMSCLQKYDPECQAYQLAADDINEVPPALEEVEIVAKETKAQSRHIQLVPEVKEFKDEKEENNTTYFSEVDYKNGAVFENYCWSQTLKEIELLIKLPKQVKSSKHIKMELTSNSILIKALLNQPKVLVSGEVWSKFKHNDVVWTLMEGKLHISLDKSQQIWWDKLFCKEPSIDIKRLDCEQYIDELPESSQAAIHKLRILEMEKQKNNIAEAFNDKSSEQLDRLKQAWNAEGSPFKGQPFDPSVIKFN
uniref:Nuclear migration protein nudC n=1 Tax=Glossina brevipalpis TaxID=37001 RepID=A0A1A9WE96_9MUSC